MARPLLPDGPGGSIQLRPQATPVDTFVRPIAAGASPLGQLASALSSVSPELRQFGAGVSQREAETAAAQGEAWATDMQASKDVWDGLVKDGKVAPSQNPHFVLAAKRKFGQVAASQFQVMLKQNLAQLGTSPTPDQFEQAVSDARTSFLKDHAGAASNDLAFMQGFNGPAEQTVDEARRAFASQHAKQFEEDTVRTYAQAMHKAATDALDNPTHTDADVAAAINKQASELATAHAGLTGAQIASAKVSVLFDLMDSTGNPQLIKRVAGQIQDGKGTLADTPEFYERFHEHADHVTADQRQKEQEQHITEERAQKDAQDAAKDALLGQFKNGGTLNTAPVIASLQAAGVKDAGDFVAKTVHDLPELDPTNFIGYRSSIATGKYPSVATLTAAANAGKISRTQYDGLLNDIQEAHNAERALAAAGMPTTEAIWSSPAMKIIEDGIKGAAASKAVRGPLGQIISYTGFTENDVNQAIAQAKIDLAQNLAANWSKYGSGAAMAQLASQSWRSYAFNNHVITWQEANDGQPVLSPQPSKKGQQERKREGQTPQEMTFNASEVQEGRAMLLRWPKMSADQRKTWLEANPRNAPLLTELMKKSTPKAK